MDLDFGVRDNKISPPHHSPFFLLLSPASLFLSLRLVVRFRHPFATLVRDVPGGRSDASLRSRSSHVPTTELLLLPPDEVFFRAAWTWSPQKFKLLEHNISFNPRHQTAGLVVGHMTTLQAVVRSIR